MMILLIGGVGIVAILTGIYCLLFCRNKATKNKEGEEPKERSKSEESWWKKKLRAAENHCCGRLNPYLPAFYLVLVVGGYLWTITVIFGYLTYWEKLFTDFIVCLTLACFVQSSLTPPHPPMLAVDDQKRPCHGGDVAYNFHRYEEYCAKGTGLFYEKGKMCHICQIVRPVRAKHCYVCHRCVIRFDHHCPWINNDVGADNFGYFVLFLFVTASLCIWVSFLTGSILRNIIVINNFWTLPSASYFLLFQFFMFYFPHILLLFCFATSISLILL